ncbi:MAG TPA: glycosyltransferase family 2 protein [Actinomycetota bacterium]|nr:glycosyltransferase family 2 protein [Actinomycetota bacterium]
MEQRPLVSVITPCLDPGDRLTRCLESVAAQTYDRVEHIVVDGGSLDGTVDLLRAREGIHWISEPDGGQTHAINKGVAMSSGAWVGWLCADDVLTPAAVERVVASLTSTPGADWAYGDCVVYGRVPRERFRGPRILRARFLERGNPVGQAGVFVARSAWNAVGGLDEELHFLMDLDLWIALFDAGFEAVYVPEILAEVEIHDDSKSGARGSAARNLHECAAVWAKHGRKVAAGIGLGRAAAHQFSGPLTRRSLLARVADLEATIPRPATRSGQPVSEPSDLGFARAALRAGALAEAVHVEHDRGVARLRHLIAIEPWRFHHTRARLLGALLRRLTFGRLPRSLV